MEINENNEPVLGKADPRPGDYREIKWREFIELRKAAQECANKFGYPVYLVGSSLSKEIPRDIDISVIIPLDKYEEMFGTLPTQQEHYGEYLASVYYKAFSFTEPLHFCIDYHLDIKVCPDTWWPDKPKMLLAEPDKKE